MSSRNRKDPHVATSMSDASFETVVTRPSRRTNRADKACESVRERFDSVFPTDFTARDYSRVLLAKFRALPAEGRSAYANRAIDELLKLERHCFANCVTERAAFFAQAKKDFASEILEAVARRMDADSAYRTEHRQRWMSWIFSKAFTDVSNFWFWSAWHDRLEMAGSSVEALFDLNV